MSLYFLIKETYFKRLCYLLPPRCATRGRVEVLLAGATAPEPLPVKDLVEADLWDQLPADLSALLAILPQADLYLQDEIQVAFHPTLTRVWSRHRPTWVTPGRGTGR